MKLARDEAFFLGASVINYAAAGLAAVAVMAVVIAVEASRPRSFPLVVLLAGVSLVIATGVVFLPVSKTLWAAIELIMKPLEAWERAEAVTAVADVQDPPVGLT